MNKTNMYDAILDVATSLIQTQGYNAFSFRDIANQIGIKTSSIHYHFPTKPDLANAVITRYSNAFMQAFENLTNDFSIKYRKKIHLFLDYFFSNSFFANKKMCLGGTLGVDVLTLPDSTQLEVRALVKRMEKCLEELLLQGKASGEFQFKGSAKIEATMIMSLLEGALLLARLFDDESRLILIRDQIETRLWTTSEISERQFTVIPV